MNSDKKPHENFVGLFWYTLRDCSFQVQPEITVVTYILTTFADCGPFSP